MGLRAAPRRQVHPARRGHRPGALDRGIGERDPRGHEVARPRLGRRAVLPDAAPDALQAGRRAADRLGPCLLRLHVARGARSAAQGTACKGRKTALRWPLAARARKRQAAAERPPAGDPLSHAGGGRGRLARPGEGPDRVPEQRARRPGAAACRRRADLQLRRGGRRPRHGHHPRHPRRRSRQQHAAPDPHLQRIAEEAACLRPRADDPRRRRRAALQAPRRGQRDAIPRRRLPARSARELSCPSGLVSRRRGDVLEGILRFLV